VRCGAVHEKLDVTAVGRRGGGGEYAPQIGFGWSNGVLLHFLDAYCGPGPVAELTPGTRSAAPLPPPE
jgi:alpha,alpha-trehalase